MKKELPDIIKQVGFDFSWDERKVWVLDIPVAEMDISELIWHFDIPFWGNSNIKPIDVVLHPELYPTDHLRMIHSDLAYPLDIMYWKNRWLLLDGLHRLLKAQILGLTVVKVRKVPHAMIPNIKRW
jgi:hypothetical protein